MKTINQKIVPMVWFDHQAEEAARFYTEVFPNSKIESISRYVKEGFEQHGQKEGSVMTVDFVLDGQKLSVINGGPHFKINPSISFFATYELESQVDTIWKHLSEGGMIMMALDKYPWSAKYGFLQDRFGVCWQISLGSRKDVGNQSITPSFMFVKEHYGEAEAAINFYTSVFKNSKVQGAMYYGANESPEKEGTVKHAQFSLDGQTFMVMDSGHQHQFTFNEAISLRVYCQNQEEIDYYWEKLSEGGDPKAQICGWLKDKFGVSWTIVPTIMDHMLKDPDTEKIGRVTKAFMQMKKFDIEKLKRAFEGK